MSERFARRRRRHTIMVAGVAVFGVMVASAATAVIVSGPRGPEPTVGRVAVAEPGEAPPIAEVWPEAYHKISAKLEDGHKLYPRLLVNDHELLVATEASFENTDQLWIVDLDTRAARLVVQLPEPEDNSEGYASHFTVGSGYVVWQDSYSEDDTVHTRLWKAALSGGEPELVTTFPESDGTIGDQLVIDDGAIYFSDQQRGGVTRVPLAGGEPEPVPGSAGYHIVSWPWVGRPGLQQAMQLECDGAGDGRTCVSTSEPSEFRLFTQLRNLDTGQVLSAKLPDPDFGNVACGVTYCLGVSPSGGLTAFTRDGKRDVELPGVAGPDARLPALDRFVVLTQENPMPQGLYDLKTGRHGNFGIKPNRDGSMQGVGYANANSRLITWPVDDGRSFALIDLDAIR